MEIIEYQGELIGDRRITLPSEIWERVKGKKAVKIVLYMEGPEQAIDQKGDWERMQAAMAEYKAKYPDDDVSIEDFRYVGILPKVDLRESKATLIQAIGEGYNDL